MKVAVFVAGPYRYADQVHRSLERLFPTIDYSAFYFVWKEDLGNKVRDASDNGVFLLASDKKTKAFITADPYSVDDFKNSIGTKTNSGSSINATMGMFFSMNALCQYLEALPDADEYTHIVRLRTDCLVFDSLEKYIDSSSSNVVVSNNQRVSSSWISDHIMIAPKTSFFLFWKHDGMKEIYGLYSKGKRNPEKTLSYIAQKESMNVLPVLNRNVDYHIVYSPVKTDEPNWLYEFQSTRTVAELFDNIEGLVKQNKQEISQFEDKESKFQIGLHDHLSIKEKVKHHLLKRLPFLRR